MTQTTPPPFERIVFIHGVGLCAEAWDAMRPDFDAYDCTFLELPAHGASSAPPAQSMDDMVNRLAPEIPKASLVIGHSIGALITLEMLAKGQKEITSAVLISPIYQRDEDAKIAVKARAAALLRGDNNPEVTLDRWYGSTGYQSARAQTRAWLQNGGAGYAAAYRVFADYEDLPRETLAQIAAPILVITGADDPNSTPHMTQNLAEALPHATAKIIPNTAHMLTMTHPKIIANSIRNWIEGAPDDA